MNILKNNQKGEGEIVYIIIIAIVIVVFVAYPIFKGIYSRTAGNKTAIDLQYKFNKARIEMGDFKKTIDVDTWCDYEGEQIQIISKDGTVYLTSSYNVVLYKTE